MVEKNIQIVARFFEALEILIKKKVFANYNQFAIEYQFDRSQLMRSMKNPASRRFEVSWIAPLILRHGLNEIWLFSGKGKPFQKTQKSTKVNALA